MFLADDAVGLPVDQEMAVCGQVRCIGRVYDVVWLCGGSWSVGFADPNAIVWVISRLAVALAGMWSSGICGAMVLLGRAGVGFRGWVGWLERGSSLASAEPWSCQSVVVG